METLGLRIGKLSAETAIEVQRAGQRVDDTGAGEGRRERGDHLLMEWVTYEVPK